MRNRKRMQSFFVEPWEVASSRDMTERIKLSCIIDGIVMDSAALVIRACQNVSRFELKLVSGDNINITWQS
jgi:hypothetical protein